MQSITLEEQDLSPLSHQSINPGQAESAAGEFELPCEHHARQRPPCLLSWQEISFFYVLHSDEAQWEASGSVLMTLVPTHLHPEPVSSAFCCRDSLEERHGWESYGRNGILTYHRETQIRVHCRTIDHLLWHRFLSIHWNAYVSNHWLLICISGINGLGRGKQIYTRLKKLPQGLPSSLFTSVRYIFSAFLL